MSASVGTVDTGAPQPIRASRRAAWIGRAVLYIMTLLGLGLLASAVLSLVWLAGWWSDRLWLVAMFRAVLGLTFLSAGMAFLNLFVVHRFFVPARDYLHKPLRQARVQVALTAWNDENCIAQAVADFKGQPQVHRLIVVENNSTDRTAQVARDAGADAVVTETAPGYGSCCMRALAEAARGLGEDDVIILCEGDMTFSAADVPKFLAYLENCDLVLGTRATQELRETNTQMDWLINPANQIVAKMIQVRFWGTRLTDCGCTYRAMRVSSYRRLADHLWVRGNHFSPHMYIQALKLGLRVIEIPVVFRHRWGFSKGVGSNKIKAAKVAMRMLGLLYAA